MPATVEHQPRTATRVPGGSFLLQGAKASETFTPEDFSESHAQVRRTTKRFFTEEVAPRTADMERQQEGVARGLISQAADLGLLGVLVPERFDGLEMDVTTQMLVAEELAAYASFSTTYGAHSGIGTLPLVFFGTPDQKQRYLPRLVSGEIMGAYCLSEPQAGSDSLNSLTRAELSEDGRHYVLTGQKMWISNGGWADLYTVFAKVDGERFTAFLVERSFDGVLPGPEEHKMGLRGSSTTPLFLDGVRVPVENVLGEVGRGHVIAFNVLNMGRLELAAACVGGAKDTIAEAASYALQRQAFGKPIASFGAIRQKLADMAVLTFAGESLLYRTSGLIDAALKGISWDEPEAPERMLAVVEDYAIECSIAKVHLSEALDFAADEAVQIHGGYGYHQDYAVERNYRDSRINRIFEGTNEINRLLTTGMLLKRAAKQRLKLMEAIVESSGSPIGDAADGRDPGGIGEHRSLVGSMRRATLEAIGVAVKRYGRSIEQRQQVMAAIADMMAEVYAAESALLRTEKIASRGRSEQALDLLAVLTRRSLGIVRDRARIVIGACAEGAALASLWDRCDRMTSALPIDLPAARDRIAGRVLEATGFRV